MSQSIFIRSGSTVPANRSLKGWNGWNGWNGPQKPVSTPSVPRAVGTVGNGWERLGTVEQFLVQGPRRIHLSNHQEIYMEIHTQGIELWNITEPRVNNLEAHHG